MQVIEFDVIEITYPAFIALADVRIAIHQNFRKGFSYDRQNKDPASYRLPDRSPKGDAL